MPWLTWAALPPPPPPPPPFFLLPLLPHFLLRPAAPDPRPEPRPPHFFFFFFFSLPLPSSSSLSSSSLSSSSSSSSSSSQLLIGPAASARVARQAGGAETVRTPSSLLTPLALCTFLERL